MEIEKLARPLDFKVTVSIGGAQIEAPSLDLCRIKRNYPPACGYQFLGGVAVLHEPALQSLSLGVVKRGHKLVALGRQQHFQHEPRLHCIVHGKPLIGLTQSEVL